MTVAVQAQKDSRGRLRSLSQTVNDQPSLTIQSDADKADIRHILSRGGIVENLNRADAMFLDVSEFTDFADLTRQTKVAELEFMKLPSKTREMFAHDVANWLDAAHDQEKRDAMDLAPDKAVSGGTSDGASGQGAEGALADGGSEGEA